MLAATIRDGQVLVEEHPDPEPGAGEVLVRVRAAGLNGADILQLRGNYPAPPGSPPDIPGLEMAGEVVQRGVRAERFERGARVMGIVGGGAQAELCVIHERQLMPVPETLEWPQAGGFPEVFTTAHDALFTQGGLSMGERVLVHGAAGGVGTAGVQLGAQAGAHVVATARRPENHQAILALGAHEVVAPDGFTDRGPFDVVLELIGAPNIPGDVRSLRTLGRIVVIGIGGGFGAELDLLALMGKRGSVMSSTLRVRPLEEKALTARRVERDVLPLLRDGRVKVPVAATFPLAEVARAYDQFQAGGKLGKIVVLP